MIQSVTFTSSKTVQVVVELDDPSNTCTFLLRAFGTKDDDDCVVLIGFPTKAPEALSEAQLSALAQLIFGRTGNLNGPLQGDPDIETGPTEEGPGYYHCWKAFIFVTGL